MKILFSFFLVALAAKRMSAQDKSLDYYVSAALHNSPLLKDYTNQARANLIDSLRIRASFKPQVIGNSINTYAPAINGWGYDNAITNGANINELVSISQKLVSRQNLQNQYEAIRLQNEGLSASGKISEQDLRKTITGQYITAYGILQQLLYNKEMLDLLKTEETILKQLTDRGVYRQTDYLTFLVTFQQQQVQVSQIRQQYQNEFGTLNYLSGLHDTSFASLEAPLLESAVLPELENTVFYRQFEIDSMKLRNSNAQVDFSYKPKVNLYGDAGYVSSFMYLPYKNFGISFGVNIAVPIYDGHQKKMQHDKIAIAEQTREQYRDFYKSQYGQQIAQLMQQLQSAQQLINETTAQLKFAEGLIEANKKLLETGDARIADYIIAIGNYITAKNVITQNSINKMQIINQLNYWNRK
ncbi:MAG: TolC family protein [Bacteroidetes bacterium]|nr:TolC family protein [Bacteroidota bacterium]MBS1973564.1 TolC family protein [Bacteroidota bacterium]